jgi:hypothetical protein
MPAVAAMGSCATCRTNAAEGRGPVRAAPGDRSIAGDRAVTS